MTKRKAVAMAAMTALPLFAGSAQSAVAPTPAPTARTVELPAPQWVWITGMEGEELTDFEVFAVTACRYTIAPATSFACRIAWAW